MFSEGESAAAMPGWLFNGDAYLDPELGGVLTEPVGSSVGSMFYADPVAAESSFSVSFDYAMDGGSGADGLAVALLDASRIDQGPRSVGWNGEDLGWFGLLGTAVLFDSYGFNVGDPGFSSVRVSQLGPLTPRLGVVGSSGAVSVRGTHHAEVVVDFAASVVSARLDGAQVVSVPVVPGSLPDRFFVGFTAATGLYTDQHSVANVELGGDSRVVADPGPLQPFETSGGPNPASVSCTPCYGDPVSANTGNFFDSVTDLELAGRLPFAWTRTYSVDRAGTLGPLGSGWTSPLTARLIPAAGPGDPVVVVQENGARVQFEADGVGGYATLPRFHATLARDAGSGEWLFTRQHVTTMRFAADGRVLSWADRNDETVQVGYDTALRPVSVSAGDGRSLSLTYNAAGRISRVTGPSGRGGVSYAYTGTDLTTVTDARGKKWLYGYDAAHRMTSMTTPRGAVTTTSYDALDRVVSQTEPVGRVTTFAYQDLGVSADGAHLTVTRITDPSGVVVEDRFSNGWLVEHVLDPDGPLPSRTSYHLDSQGNRTITVDPTGAVSTTQYNSDGAPIATTDALGNTTATAYNEFAEPTSHSDALGRTTTWAYDEHGNVTTITTPGTDGEVIPTMTGAAEQVVERAVALAGGSGPANTEMQYQDPAHPGDVTAVTDPLGGQTTLSYDAAGFLASSTDQLGRRTTFTHNNYGQLLTVVDPRGNAAGATAGNYRSTNTYDTGGLQLTAKDPLGHGTTWTYDADGNRVTTRDGAGNTWTTTYDLAGRPTAVTDPLAATTTTEYDGAGRTVAVTDPAGDRTTSSYDGHGWLSTTTTPEGNRAGATEAERAAATTTRGYDAVGRLTTEEVPDPAGGEELATRYSYDELGRLTHVEDPTGATTTREYDAAGQLLAVTDPILRITRYGFDPAGRVTTVTDPAGNVTSTSYDQVGNPLSVTDPIGRTTTWTYDAAHQPTSVTDPRGFAPDAAPQDYTTTYQYDLAGNRTEVRSPTRVISATTYDRASRATQVTNARGKTTRYTYNNADQILTVTTPDGGVTRTSYDPTGRAATLTDPRGNITTWSYDPAGRLASATDPLGRTRTTTWTANSQLHTVTTARGTTTHAYDPLGQLTGTSYSDTTPAASYQYDRAGRLTTTSTAGASGFTQTYEYDPAGQLTTWTNDQRTYHLDYDEAGNLTDLDYPAPGSVRLGWDYDNTGQPTRLTLTDPAADEPTLAAIDYGYDNAGNLTSWSNGTISQARDYDPDGFLQRVATGSEEYQSSTQYGYDPNGNPTSIHTERGDITTTRSFLYDANDRLTAACTTATCTASKAAQAWAYDKAGNILTQRIGPAATGTTTTNTYDTANQLTTRTTGTQPAKTLSYDADGNLTADGAGRTWTYDLPGRTTSTTSPTGTTTYRIDTAGQRVASTTGGVTQTLDWNPLGDMPLLLQASTDTTSTLPVPAPDLATAGAVTDTYDAGDTLTSRALAWYGQDLTNSITDVFTAQGTPDQATNYSPFGVPTPVTSVDLPTTPTLPAPLLGYTGALTDPDATIHLGLRSYDPTTGRFTSPDPAGHSAANRADGGYDSLYTYVHNQPLLLTDPTGLCDWNPFSSSPDACDLYNTIALAMRGQDDSALGNYAHVATEAWVNLGRGASLGLSDSAANRLSKGASCTVANDSFVARTYQLLGGVGAIVVPGGGAAGIAGRGGAKATQLTKTATATSKAANAGVRALPAFPKALSGGPANTHVYFGMVNGKPAYAGITNNLGRRQAQHGSKYVLDPITTSAVTRGEARAIEQALIVRNPGFNNKINSISPNHSYYQDAVDWGEAWLVRNGY